MKITVGVRRGGQPPYEVDGEPMWVEIDGMRLPDSAGITAIKHEALVGQVGKVTIEFLCGGYETVPCADTLAERMTVISP